ncbi:flavodoxin [Ostertagia ostertagi]
MHSLLVLYGSETGTAEDVAEGLWKEARLLDVPARLFGMDEYDIENLPNERAVAFVVATTGQGEIPPNMRSAWLRMLRKSLPRDWLQHINFGVLGLGDSSYQKYNFASKKLFRRLLQLGANSLLDIGLADDQHELGVDGAAIPWKKEFWEKLRSTNLFHSMKVEVDHSIILPPKYQLQFDNDSSNCRVKPDTQAYHEVVVDSNSRVTAAEHFQKYSRDSQYIYDPGDVLMVQPCNLSESVHIALEALKYSDDVLDRPLQLIPSDDFIKLPPNWLMRDRLTLRSCFLRMFDLQVIPRKSFFQTLASISTDPDEKEKLLEFASPQGIDDYLDYTVRCRRTTAEVLRDFSRTSAAIPPERLFDLFTTIRPRAFSIASAPSQNTIEILVAKVQAFASITMTSNEFSLLRCETAADSILFFGCRGKKLDFYFESEWQNMPTTQVFTAFSICAKFDAIGREDGFVFIAGSAGDMPRDVGAALEAIASQHGWAEGTFLKKLESVGRIQYETWS